MRERTCDRSVPRQSPKSAIILSMRAAAPAVDAAGAAFPLAFFVGAFLTDAFLAVTFFATVLAAFVLATVLLVAREDDFFLAVAFFARVAIVFLQTHPVWRGSRPLAR